MKRSTLRKKERRFRERECLGKRFFRSKTEADQHIPKLTMVAEIRDNRRKHSLLQSYLCSYCNRYHIGHEIPAKFKKPT